MSGRKVVMLLVIGIIIGAAGAVYLPGKVRPYLPESIAGKITRVTGTVLAKEKQANALRLTIDTPEGALVATFTQKVDETDLLVNVNDKVEIGLAKYEPFVSDPRIYRVLKGASTPAPETTPTLTGPAATKAPRKQTSGRKERHPGPGE